MATKPEAQRLGDNGRRRSSLGVEVHVAPKWAVDLAAGT